jgi:hypothetical protein
MNDPITLMIIIKDTQLRADLASKGYRHSRAKLRRKTAWASCKEISV